MQTVERSRRIVGLIPAAGRATRLGSLPHSKEIHLIGAAEGGNQPASRPKAVSQYLLEKMRAGGIEYAYFVLRPGKWDIPAHFTDGQIAGLPVGYVVTNLPYGAPYTLDQAYPFVRDAVVALGFPDILFPGDEAYRRLLAHQARSDADVVLGLFPADRPQMVDMVAVDRAGRVTRVEPKPAQTDLADTWGVAVWTPAFSHFLHETLARRPVPAAGDRELFIGDVIQAGIRGGLRVEGVRVADAPYVDIGTPETLARVRRDGPPK